jgi:hypothetical protein
MSAALSRPRGTSFCLVALVVGLGACANGPQYPSLARRPAERVDTGTPSAPPAPPTPAPLSGEVTAKLAALQETARVAHARFAGRRSAAERAAAGAGPLGSDSWAAASVALAGLEEAHDQQSQALATIDQMQVDQQVADAGIESADTTAITAARIAIATDADADGAVVTRLRARLGGN